MSETPDLLALLQRAIDQAREQRRIDKTPCPKCGGDRLRADFTISGRCHANANATEQESA